MFNVHPNETIVLEDILQSQITAFNAGYIVIGVYDKNSVININENKKYSHLYINDFNELIKIIEEENR